MATFVLGQVGLNPRGAYDSATAYNRLDCVSYDGSSYIALADNTGVAPTNTSTWMPLALGQGGDPAWNYLSL